MREGTDRTTESGGNNGETVTDAESGAVEAVGTYETDDGVVFYDTENPLAWMQSEQTVKPEEMV